MYAYLVQHARAKDKREDPLRSLTEAGWSDARKVAAHAAVHAGVQVARIWNSGKTRAVQTAESLAEQLKPPLGVRQAEHMGPVDNPAIWAERLMEMEQDVMLVGHLPHLGKLADLLLTGEEDKGVIDFQNAGIVCLRRVVQKRWAIRWILTPELVSE